MLKENKQKKPYPFTPLNKQTNDFSVIRMIAKKYVKIMDKKEKNNKLSFALYGDILYILNTFVYLL